MRNEARAAMRAGNTEDVAGEFGLPEVEKKEFKFKSFFTSDTWKKGFRKIGARNLVIILSVLLIGGAVYANWRLFGKAKTAETSKPASEITQNGEAGTKTPESYFAASQVERRRARDEAIEVLQNVVDNSTTETDASAKEEAMSGISTIAANIALEANIESLIKAKGFENCVAVINGEKASIVVSSEGLKPNQLSQILEIVYVQASILPENVTITEVG